MSDAQEHPPLASMSGAEGHPPLPSASNKWPTPFVNLANASAYPPWTPVNTRERTAKVFRTCFYTTVGAYAWIYILKRATFKVGLPLTVIGFATVATGAKGMICNLRQKNDGWNTFGAVLLGNIAVLATGFRKTPLKHKVMTGLSGAAAAAFVEHFIWSQSTSFAGSGVRFSASGDPDKKQSFWDVYQRRPLLETVEYLGVGRGVIDK